MMLDVIEKYHKVFEQIEVNDEAMKYALFDKWGGRVGLRPPDSYDWNVVRYLIYYFLLFKLFFLLYVNSSKVIQDIWRLIIFQVF